MTTIGLNMGTHRKYRIGKHQGHLSQAEWGPTVFSCNSRWASAQCFLYVALYC